MRRGSYGANALVVMAKAPVPGMVKSSPSNFFDKFTKLTGNDNNAPTIYFYNPLALKVAQRLADPLAGYANRVGQIFMRGSDRQNHPTGILHAKVAPSSKSSKAKRFWRPRPALSIRRANIPHSPPSTTSTEVRNASNGIPKTVSTDTPGLIAPMTQLVNASQRYLLRIQERGD
jgi:hypothetical protein